MATSIRSTTHTRTDRAVTEAIAKETDTSVDIVRSIFEEEITQLASDAKITTYLGVIAGRRVRMKLRKH